MLDKLQNEYDIVFVVAGTNKTQEDNPTQPKRIGAPADSINSLVVNATSILKEPANYTREGPVLNFFRKPDSSLDYTENGISDICDVFPTRNGKSHAH